MQPTAARKAAERGTQRAAPKPQFKVQGFGVKVVHGYLAIHTQTKKKMEHYIETGSV